MFFAEHVYLVNYKRYLENFHAHCVNKSLRNEEQCDFFLELNKTNCFHQLKISHLETNSISGVAAFLLRKYISFSSIRLEVQFVVFLCNMITRN